MRIGHFESLKPVCPRCKTEHQALSPLTVANVAQQTDEIIIEGSLVCSAPKCQAEYPIIDGIPIIITPVRKYVNDNFYHVTMREDLSSLSESILGDFSGPGSEFNSIRHYLSTYGWDHYGDQAPDDEFPPQQEDTTPGSISRCLQAGFTLTGDITTPALDIGCALGRSTFDVADKSSGLTLGIDLNFSLLRVAQKVLREKQISFPLKRTGVVYDPHQYQVDMPASDNVDFWACDASALPFDNETFGFVSALNVLDTVNSPLNFLRSIDNALKTSGKLILSTPYDWSPPAPLQNWLGGHAQRRAHQGSSEAVLRNHLSADANTPGKLKLELTGEIEHHPWNLRVHSRRTAHYDVHIVTCEKGA